jgi:hypothetical protein
VRATGSEKDLEKATGLDLETARVTGSAKGWVTGSEKDSETDLGRVTEMVKDSETAMEKG